MCVWVWFLQTYFQPAIDALVQASQAKYNKSSVVVYNTLQGYLKGAR